MTTEKFETYRVCSGHELMSFELPPFCIHVFDLLPVKFLFDDVL